MTEKVQRTDADNTRLRTQTRSLVRDRILSETESLTAARDANTIRLKAQRLHQEALDREAAAAAPPKPKGRKRS